MAEESAATLAGAVSEADQLLSVRFLWTVAIVPKHCEYQLSCSFDVQCNEIH